MSKVALFHQDWIVLGKEEMLIEAVIILRFKALRLRRCIGKLSWIICLSFIIIIRSPRKLVLKRIGLMLCLRKVGILSWSWGRLKKCPLKEMHGVLMSRILGSVILSILTLAARILHYSFIWTLKKRKFLQCLTSIGRWAWFTRSRSRYLPTSATSMSTSKMATTPKCWRC